jgi:hypothetical protein
VLVTELLSHSEVVLVKSTDRLMAGRVGRGQRARLPILLHSHLNVWATESSISTSEGPITKFEDLGRLGKVCVPVVLLLE